ncbi:hypothetical protein [Halosolutus gelatinilyticus]|uniref:hypothetical protein n=1 Tax=Halosolutus gelatinilyticus TaxID=2931975 RepID=UPI001FF5A14F|nr:hypothetical protein [Halosolutus gelatinilyticus]
MATQSVADELTLGERAIDTAREYAIVVYPLAFGVALLVLGMIFQATGKYVEAGVAGAISLIVCLITVVVYVIFWLLGRYGH